MNIEKDSKDRGGRKKVSTIVLVFIAVIGIVCSLVFYGKYQDVKKNPQKITNSETTKLVDQVGKLMTLPKGETPTVATVQDKSKLKDQPFFNDAQKDDKLLIYTNAKKAIIYRQASNRIINVGPIAINSDQGLDNNAEKAKQ